MIGLWAQRYAANVLLFSLWVWEDCAMVVAFVYGFAGMIITSKGKHDVVLQYCTDVYRPSLPAAVYSLAAS